MKAFAQLGCCLVTFAASACASDLHHYVYFGQDREQITNGVFLSTKALEGAQLRYTWRELERQKDQYEFGDIQRDLSFLQSHGKKLFIQLQDSSFSPKRVPVPRYLLEGSQFHGGAANQYDIENDDQDHAKIQGWVARRWDSAVQERFHRLLLALGREFDGKIEGINLPETAVDIPLSGRLCPQDFAAEIYRDAVLTNMTVLKRAFPRSVAMQYANFMPGGLTYLQSVYQRARELRVAVGGPDLLPFRPFQMQNSYPLIRESAGTVPSGIAAQDGNYETRNPRTGQQVTVPEMIEFASGFLKVTYVFWCTQEPFYSKKVIPLLQAQR
jgi:hypothetical protein